MRRMRARTSESMRGLPGRRPERRLQPDGALRDATARPWPAESARAPPSSEATTVVSRARVENTPEDLLSIGEFDVVPKASELPDHSLRSASLGSFVHGRASFLVPHALVQNLPN